MGVQGAFIISKYQAEKGTFIYSIKVQQETIDAAFGGAANTPPSGGTTENLPSAIAKGGRRKIGMHPRYASCKVTATGITAVNKLGSTVRIPILSKTTAWKKGDVGVYQADTLVITRIAGEDVV